MSSYLHAWSNHFFFTFCLSLSILHSYLYYEGNSQICNSRPDPLTELQTLFPTLCWTIHQDVCWSAEIHTCVLPLKLSPPLTFRISQNSSVLLPVTLNFPDTFLILKTGQFPLHIFCHNHPLISIHTAAISCPNFSGPAPEGCQSISN